MYYSINLDISMSNKAKSIDKKIFPQSMFSNLVLTTKTTSGRREIRRGGQNIWILLMKGQLLPHQINIPLVDTIKQGQVWNTLMIS